MVEANLTDSAEHHEEALSHDVHPTKLKLHRKVQNAAVASDPLVLLEMMKIRETAMLLYGACAFFVIILAFFFMRRGAVQKNKTKKATKYDKGGRDNLSATKLHGAFPPLRRGPSVRSDMILYDDDDDQDLASVHLDESSVSGSAGKDSSNASMMSRTAPVTTRNHLPSIAVGEEESKRLKLPSALPTCNESSKSTNPPDSHHSRHQAGSDNDPASSGTMGSMFLKMMNGGETVTSNKLKRAPSSNRSRDMYSASKTSIDPTLRPRFHRKSKEKEPVMTSIDLDDHPSSTNHESNTASLSASDTVMVVPFPCVTVPQDIERAVSS